MTETKETDDKALLAEARENYKLAEELCSHNRKLWLQAAKFRALDQWPEDTKKKRTDEGLPCLVVDKLDQYVKQVVNDGRQNRPAVKVRPVDEAADIQAAEAFQGVIRGICNRSNAADAFDTSLDHAAGNGYGYMRVVTEYIHAKTFNQDIAVRRVRNPLAVLLGPHQMADGSDAEFGFFIEKVPKKTYKKQYPGAKVTDWKSDGFTDGWSDEKDVRVCEYFYKVEEPGLLHLLADGTSVTDEDYQLKLKELSEGEEPTPIIESRNIPIVKVKWCRLSGAEVLEKNKWLGRYIPIIPVYGDESDIEGKVTYTGLIFRGKDPQILHNFSRTAFAQRVALTPKAPWLAAEESIEDHPEWATANSGTHQVLKYRAFNDAGEAIPPPRRVDPSDVPAGFAQDAQASEHDIQGALGMYNASLGEKSNEKSGRAIMARQREGDTATFHYQDNLNRAIRHLGRILVDLIPKVYDSTRTIRLLGEDGSTTEAMVDPRQRKAVERQGSKTIYNFNVGIFDVDVAAGPSYTTKRQESADAMIELTRANPTMWQTHGDLIVASQDWPNAEEFAKRSKLALPPPIAQALAAEEQSEGESPEVLEIKQRAQQMLDQAKQQMDEMQQGLQQLQQENDTLKQQAALKAAEVEVKDKDADTKLYQAETQRMQALAPAMTPENIAAIVQQTVQQIMAQEVPDPPDLTQQPPQAPPGAFFTPEGM